MLHRFIFQIALGYVLVGAVLAPQSISAAVSSAPIAVSTVILSKNTCQFNNPGAATLDFGSLTPITPVDVTVSATLSFVCRGSSAATYAISDDDGLHELGPGSPRLQHTLAPSVFIPYALTLSPATGTAPRNVDQILTVTGTLLGADYQSAIAGNYSDIVTISIQP